MNASIGTNLDVSQVIAAAHFAQAGSNGHDTAPTTCPCTTTLDRNHFVMIEVDTDHRHNGQHQRFWKGYILEREHPTSSVIVAFARAADDSNVSRSEVVAKLNEAVRRNGYLLFSADDLTTGQQIAGMPSPAIKNTSKKPAITPADG